MLGKREKNEPFGDEEKKEIPQVAWVGGTFTKHTLAKSSKTQTIIFCFHKKKKKVTAIAEIKKKDEQVLVGFFFN